MKAPVPVIFTAVLLGLFAAFQLLLSGLMAAGSIFSLHHGLQHPPGAAPNPFPPSFLPFMMFGFCLFYIATAVWCIWTLVGLLRLRSWARFSVLVIAGLMAAFSAMAMLVSIAMPFLMPATPGISAGISHGIFLFEDLLFAILTAIGIALLVYYNLAATRNVFLQNAYVNLTPPNTSTGRPRPTAIAVISWFFMISAPFLLIYAIFPLPAFLFGVAITGPAARLVYLAFAVLSFATGYGLFRLRSQARILLVAWLAFGVLNMLATLSPWGARNFHAYLDEFMSGHATSTPNLFPITGFVLVMFAICVVFYGFILWLVHRHRTAFTPLPPPPPAPAFDGPFAG